MAATPGNQWWKLRSKHGRDKIFSTPEILWEACCEYFEATNNRKWQKKDWVGKDGMEVIREVDTPYSLAGLFIFLDIERPTWILYRKRKDFINVTTRVESIIFTQKFEGAAVGHYQQNIIIRDLGMVEKTQTDLTSNGQTLTGIDMSQFTTDELYEIIHGQQAQKSKSRTKRPNKKHTKKGRNH